MSGLLTKYLGSETKILKSVKIRFYTLKNSSIPLQAQSSSFTDLAITQFNQNIITWKNFRSSHQMDDHICKHATESQRAPQADSKDICITLTLVTSSMWVVVWYSDHEDGLPDASESDYVEAKKRTW